MRRISSFVFLELALGATLCLVPACRQAEVTPQEDAEALRQLSEVLQENQSTNALYAKFLREADGSTPFKEYFQTYDTVAQTKHRLGERLQEIRVTPKYSRLHEILTESVRSDERLMGLEKESLLQVLHSLKQMQEMTELLTLSPEDEIRLSEEEKRLKAREGLQKAMQHNRKWLDQLNQTGVALESTRSVSNRAVGLLNAEIERLGLPHQQDNPFAEKTKADAIRSAASPASPGE